MKLDQFSLLVLGEALIDLIRQDDVTYTPLPGGSPYNLCCAAAMQNVRAAYLNPFSSDLFGQTLQNHLERLGAYPLFAPTPLPTSLSIVSINDGQPSYGFYREGVADRTYKTADICDVLEKLPPGVFHTGSLMLVPPEYEKIEPILRSAKRHGWTISLDVNLRPHMASDMKTYLDAVWSAVSYADWLKASDEDLHLMGFENIQIGNASDCAGIFRQKGCRRIALTFGAEGAYLDVEGHGLQGAAHKIEVVDTIGAGDVFWATCLAELIADPVQTRSAIGVERVLQRALTAAALTCTRYGCAPPYGHEL